MFEYSLEKRIYNERFLPTTSITQSEHSKNSDINYNPGKLPLSHFWRYLIKRNLEFDLSRFIVDDLVEVLFG